MAEIGMALETSMTANKSVNQNSTVQPAESGYPTQDCRSSRTAFETIPVVSPVGSEANCHPNGNHGDYQRPAAGQLARKIVQIDSEDSDKDTENEMVNISNCQR